MPLTYFALTCSAPDACTKGRRGRIRDRFQLLIRGALVNALTAVLTLCSLIGYAMVYTLWLKRATPQNIVIGGAVGARLGAVTNSIEPQALLLFLIVFTGTPPPELRAANRTLTMRLSDARLR
jgi:hypothetical protein